MFLWYSRIANDADSPTSGARAGLLIQTLDSPVNNVVPKSLDFGSSATDSARHANIANRTMPNHFLIPVIIAFDFLIAVTVIGLLFRNSWKPLEVQFPAQVPSEASYGRKFQSFSIGLVNFGFSVHVIIDDRFLHLTPIWIVSRFGMKPISLPWDEVQILTTPKPTAKMVKVKVRKQTITGPRWCFELLYQGSQTEESQ
jgi:hypothetical protein